MSAFLIVGLGDAEKLDAAVQRAFSAGYRLHGTTWIARTAGDMSAKEAFDALGLREARDDVVVVRLDAHTIHGIADPKVWAFVAAALTGDTQLARASVFDQVGDRK